MAAYDPKRPRPGADAEEPAPVEALLGDDGADEPAEDDLVVVETVAEELLVDDDGNVVGAAIVTDDVVLDTSTGEVVAEEVRVEEVDLRDASPNGSAARSGSEVPVAPAPEEGTANRAVLIAGLSAAGLLALLLALLLRRRRRAG